MPTPTPSTTSAQVFSCCWSVLWPPHTTAYPLPASLSQQFMFRPTLEEQSPKAGALGSCQKPAPSFHWLCRDTAALLCHSAVPKVDVLLPSRLCSLSPLENTDQQTGLQRWRKDVDLAWAAEKRLHLSGITMLQHHLVRVAKYRNKLPSWVFWTLQPCRGSKQLDTGLGKWDLPWSGLNQWLLKVLPTSPLSDNHLNNAYIYNSITLLLVDHPPCKSPLLTFF